MIIGLNNGGFYRLKYDRLSPQVFNEISRTGVNAFEFTCLNNEMLDDLLNFSLPNHNFEYISLHAPELIYKDDLITRNVLNKIRRLNEKFKFNNIIIHADNIKDPQVLKFFKHLPLSVENSDNRKDFGRTIADIMKILKNSNLNLTLDVQHCYVNDQTISLAKDFYDVFEDSIVEFHVSGYSEKFNHYTLYKTKQDEIIEFIKDKDTPIILESTYDSLVEAMTEIGYIKNYLK